ncbi:ABC transporter ATP-binding protein [Enterococcus sp. DIV1298c]|uniref:ABC transporter ATP-binding protein n=1 Tax=Enterococcus sp. DIV1298c TaxID=2815328 RepID=UPI001F5E06A9|nr:ABC transporter ATP-binding protein [Enterococcus sp. DIV1298c]
MSEVIVIEQLQKVLSKKIILDNINVIIKENECIALLGKNGAGKSTLIKIILGNYTMSSGSIENRYSKSEIGYLPQKTSFPDDLKVSELLQFVSSFSTNPLSVDKINDVLGFTEEQLKQFANTLSGGQQRILDFCLSIINQPKLLIIDEPTAGMDTLTRKRFWDIIQRLKANKTTILFTTHYIEEVDYCADRVLLLDRGKIIADDTPYRLRIMERKKILMIELQSYQRYQHKLKKVIQKHDIFLNEKKSLVELHFSFDQTVSIIKDLITIDFPLDDIELMNTSLLNSIFNGIDSIRKEDANE